MVAINSIQLIIKKQIKSVQKTEPFLDNEYKSSKKLTIPKSKQKKQTNYVENQKRNKLTIKLLEIQLHLL